jgi:dimethylargininase
MERALSITARITSPGTVDGGDICVVDRVVFIGLSNRTNREGARQLDAILQAWGYTCSPIDLTIPILREAGLLHLKSGMSYLGDRLFVLDDRLYTFSQELASAIGNHGYHNPILVGNEAYAANCIRVNDSILVAEGYPNFVENLNLAISTGRSSIRQVIPLAMSEFQKMDGGLSCLSLRW